MSWQAEFVATRNPVQPPALFPSSVGSQGLGPHYGTACAWQDCRRIAFGSEEIGGHYGCEFHRRYFTGRTLVHPEVARLIGPSNQWARGEEHR